MTPDPLRTRPWFDPSEWPWEPRFLDVDGGRMHFVDEGAPEAVPVVLVQGTPGWCLEWSTVIHTLRAAGRRVITCDPIGLGLSDRPDDPTFALARHTANLRALLAARGVDRFDLVVHDFGGPIALPLAVAEPARVRSVVVLNTWAWPLTVDPSFARQRWMVDTALMRWMYRRLGFSGRFMVKASWGTARPLTPAHHARYTDLLDTPAARTGTLAFLHATVHEDAWLSDLDAHLDVLADLPMALVWGMADTFVGRPHLDRWRARFPRAAFHPLERVGHFPQDEAGEQVAQIVATHVGR